LKDQIMVDTDAVINYITDNLGGNVGQAYANPNGDGRIRIMDTPFQDVTTTDWFHGAVQYVLDNKIMNGTSATTFDPQGGLTRAMVATILYRLADSPEVTEPSAFTDVPADQWYTDAVAWAAENGIVTGYPDGTFNPMASISRAELATMLYRFCGVVMDVVPVGYVPGDLTYTDASSVADWALTGVAFCTENGLMNGVGNNTFAPADTSTRAQGATVMQRLMTTDWPSSGDETPAA